MGRLRGYQVRTPSGEYFIEWEPAASRAELSEDELARVWFYFHHDVCSLRPGPLGAALRLHEILHQEKHQWPTALAKTPRDIRWQTGRPWQASPRSMVTPRTSLLCSTFTH